jgi:hypothetical protein
MSARNVCDEGNYLFFVRHVEAREAPRIVKMRLWLCECVAVVGSDLWMVMGGLVFEVVLGLVGVMIDKNDVGQAWKWLNRLNQIWKFTGHHEKTSDQPQKSSPTKIKKITKIKIKIQQVISSPQHKSLNLSFLSYFQIPLTKPQLSGCLFSSLARNQLHMFIELSPALNPSKTRMMEHDWDCLQLQSENEWMSPERERVSTNKDGSIWHLCLVHLIFPYLWGFCWMDFSYDVYDVWGFEDGLYCDSARVKI